MLSKIGSAPARRPPPQPLREVFRRPAEGDSARELQALLEAFRASLTNRDLLSSTDLLTTVENKARQANLPALAQEAAALRKRLQR